MSAGEDNDTPAWGALPVEQYLIRNWDPSSALSTTDQRADLIAAFLDEDILDPTLFASPPTRTPTETEISSILSPWRPQKLRRIAAALLTAHDHFIFLRTHYYAGPDSVTKRADDDTKLRAWLDDAMASDFHIDPAHEWYSVLDDAALFNFGDDWLDVYGVLPELAVAGLSYKTDRRFAEDDVAEARETAREMIAYAPHVPEEEHWEDAITQTAAWTMPPWLVVLDEEVFETGELGIVLRDKKGNPVKETTLPAEELGGWYIWSERGMFYEKWEYLVTGWKYRTRGSIMRRLLPLVRGQEGEEGK